MLVHSCIGPPDATTWRAGDAETDDEVAKGKLQAAEAGEKAADSVASQQAIRTARASGVVSEDGAALPGLHSYVGLITSAASA